MKRFAGIVMLVAFAAAGGPPAKLGFTSAPLQVQAGTCSPMMVVQLQDDGGMAVPAAADLAVGLSGAVEFHGATACASPAIIQVQIDAGTSAASFSVLGTIAGRYPVTASAAGLASATQEVEVVPGPPGRISFPSGPYTVNAGECSPPMAFVVQDVNGNVSPPPPPGLTLSFSSTGRYVRTYGDPACLTLLPSLRISAPDTGGQFYFQGAEAESPYVTVSGPGFATAQQQMVQPVSADLVLQLADGGSNTTGSALAVHAFVSNTGPGLLSAPRLVLSADGLALSEAGPYPLPDIPPGGTVEREVSGIITGVLGAGVLVSGHVETSGGLHLGPQVTSSRLVVPMVADLGGCGCSAGGLPLTVAGMAIALASALRGTRRRSSGSR